MSRNKGPTGIPFIGTAGDPTLGNPNLGKPPTVSYGLAVTFISTSTVSLAWTYPNLSTVFGPLAHFVPTRLMVQRCELNDQVPPKPTAQMTGTPFFPVAIAPDGTLDVPWAWSIVDTFSETYTQNNWQTILSLGPVSDVSLWPNTYSDTTRPSPATNIYAYRVVVLYDRLLTCDQGECLAQISWNTVLAVPFFSLSAVNNGSLGNAVSWTGPQNASGTLLPTQFFLERSTDGGKTYPVNYTVTNPTATGFTDSTGPATCRYRLTAFLGNGTTPTNGTALLYPVFDLRGPNTTGAIIGGWPKTATQTGNSTSRLNYVFANSYGTAAYDYASSCAVDPSDNILWTGVEGATIVYGKIDPSGKDLLLNAVGGSGNGQGQCIKSDSSGNIFITGFFSGTIDFGGGHVISSKIDSNNNSCRNVFVVKLTGAGTCLWAKAFGGNNVNETDYSQGLCVDSNSDIWLCGTFGGATGGTINFGGPTLNASSTSIFIAKLSGVDGSYLHSDAYGGNDGTLNDIAFGVATDSSRNVVLTGTTGSGTVICGNTFSPGIFVAKFDKDFNCLWSHGYPSAGSLMTSPAINAAGEIAISGTFQTSLTIGTQTITGSPYGSVFGGIIYSDGHDARWLKKFGDAHLYPNTASGVAFDNSGNVLFAGHFTVVFGATVPTMDFGGGQLATAGGYDVYMGVVDTNGHYIDQRSVGGPGNDFCGSNAHEITTTALAVDSSGNCIICGEHQANADYGGGNLPFFGNLDIFVAKYGRSAPNPIATVVASAVDNSGNVVVAGSFQGSINFGQGATVSSSFPSVFIAKYTAVGVLIWNKYYIGTGPSGVTAVSIDSNNNILVTGYYEGTINFDGHSLTSNTPVAGTLPDMFLVVFNPPGSATSANSYGGTNAEYGLAIALDSSNNIYLTGSWASIAGQGGLFGGISLASAGSTDVLLAKVAANLTPSWAKVLGGVNADAGYGIAVDSTGTNLYVCGNCGGGANFGGSPIGPGLFLAKFQASTGNHQWSFAVGPGTGTQAQQCVARGVAIKPNGNVVIVGQYAGSLNFGNGVVLSPGGIFMAEYDNTGSLVWAFTPNTALYGYDATNDAALDVAVDTTNRIFVVGTVSSTVWFDGVNYSPGFGAIDSFIAVYDSGQAPSTIKWFTRSSDTVESALQVCALGVNNSLYAAGSFSGVTTIGQSTSGIGSSVTAPITYGFTAT